MLPAPVAISPITAGEEEGMELRSISVAPPPSPQAASSAAADNNAATIAANSRSASAGTPPPEYRSLDPPQLPP